MRETLSTNTTILERLAAFRHSGFPIGERTRLACRFWRPAEILLLPSQISDSVPPAPSEIDFSGILEGQRVKPARSPSMSTTDLGLIEQRIYTIRGPRVILDPDLAKIYGVPTFRFKHRGAKYLPCAFTEHGALQAANILFVGKF